jgi:Uncharacterized phage-encoded protein
MTNLVFIDKGKKNAEPYTTSDIIAEYAKLSYRSVQRDIEKHESALSEFGRVRFQITPVKYGRGTNDKKIYYLNEQQATLFITFLKNTPIAIEFKKALVKEFFRMRAELMKYRTGRLELKPVQRNFTDIIKEKDGSPWAYKKYTDLAYKAAFGFTASQLRKQRNAPSNAKAVDYMTSEELRQAEKQLTAIGGLLDIGIEYEQIKDILLCGVETVKAA